MNHLKKFKKLNRTHSHRKALYRNMIESLLKHERIVTTLVKAKEIRRIVEKIITKARNKSLTKIRVVGKLLKDKDILNKLFNDIGPRFVNRNGGYTRIYKLGRRKGDGSDLAILEILPDQDHFKLDKKKKKKEKKQDSSENKVKEEKKENKIDKDNFSVYKKDDGNYSFKLLDKSGNIRLIGESYKSKEDCTNIINLIKKDIDKAEVIDLEDEQAKKVDLIRFEIYVDAEEKFVFRLKSDKGEIIAFINKGLNTKQDCEKEIEEVKMLIKESEIIFL